MSIGNGVLAYKKARVNTATPGDLLLMLYDAAIRHANRAAENLGAGDRESAHAHLLKAQAVINELMVSLDFRFEISKYLYQLYEYCYHELVRANVEKRPEGVNAVVEILRGLRSAWQQAVKEAAGRQTDVTDRAAPGRGGGGIEVAR